MASNAFGTLFRFTSWGTRYFILLSLLVFLQSGRAFAMDKAPPMLKITASFDLSLLSAFDAAFMNLGNAVSACKNLEKKPIEECYCMHQGHVLNVKKEYDRLVENRSEWRGAILSFYPPSKPNLQTIINFPAIEKELTRATIACDSK